MGTCTACKKEVPDEKLNIGESGSLCDQCQLNQDEAEHGSGELKNAYLALAGAAGASLFGTFVSVRKTSSSSVSVGEHGESSVHQSADMTGLLGGGTGLFCAIIGVWLAIRLKPSSDAVAGKRKIVLVLLVLTALWAAWAIYHGLPSSISKSW